MRLTGGKYNSRNITTPDYGNIKPTLSKTRQGIFNTLFCMISFDGRIFLDMFSGSGIMGLEALSRGFKVISFEQDKKTASAVRQSFKSLNIEPELYTGDALKLLLKLNAKIDVIFIDPPYKSNLYESSLNVILNNNILKPDGIIIMEHPINKIIKNNGFEIIKAKTYGNKQITYLKLSQEE